MIDRRHRLLVVDLGGVAAHYRPDARLEALTEATGIDAVTITSELFDSGLDHEAELGNHSTEHLVQLILDRLGHTVDLDDLVTAWSRCFEPATESLEILARQPVPCALFTNNGPMVDLCLQGPLRGLARRFETTICSWHIGATKPTRAAFDRAADQLNRTPAELFLLDDSAANVTGAREAGWSAAQVTDAIDLGQVLSPDD